MKSEKLTEAVILALQGKLTETTNEDDKQATKIFKDILDDFGEDLDDLYGALENSNGTFNSFINEVDKWQEGGSWIDDIQDIYDCSEDVAEKAVKKVYNYLCSNKNTKTESTTKTSQSKLVENDNISKFFKYYEKPTTKLDYFKDLNKTVTENNYGKLVGILQAKPEYLDILSSNGYEELDLIEDNGKQYVGIISNEGVAPISIDIIEDTVNEQE